MNKLFAVADKIEAKLKKLAAYPSQETVKGVLDGVYSGQKSNPALRGTTGISPYIGVQVAIGEDVFVSFQVIADQKHYETLINDPARANLINVMEPAAKAALKLAFPNFDFRVKVGVVM
jgi:hypothetical protein